MGFLDTIKRSWELTKFSWRLLMQDKELLLFPVFSGIGAILLFLGIVLPSLIPVLAVSGSSNAALWFMFFVWYFATSFVTIFFSAALIACVKKRMHGGDPTIGYGLSAASKRIIPILGWSLVSASVGLLLRALSNQARENGGVAGMVGQMVVGIIGFAWTIVTMFVIPVIVLEKQGVFASMKRSSSLIRKTWGEQVTMTVGVGMFFGYLTVGIILLAVLSIMLLPAVAAIPVIIVTVALILMIAILQSALSGVFNAVLYSYATGDNVPREMKEIAGEIFVKEKQQQM